MRQRASWRSTIAVIVGACVTATGLGTDVAAGARAERADVIVGLAAGTDGREARELVRRHGGRVTGRLPLIRSVTARMTEGQAAALRRSAGVLSVTRDSSVRPQSISSKQLVTTYPYAADAPDVWSRLGVTGRDVGVAVIDTGIAGSLPDFRAASGSGSRVVGSVVVHPGAATAGDAFGHGTHVAGILAGNGNQRSSSDPLRGRYIGIAPEAKLVSVKVADDDGNSTVIDVIRGLQFVVDHKDTYGIRVVNLSLESTQAQSYLTDPLDAAVEAAWFNGLVVVAAAGNRGSASDAVSYAPGNDPFVISVGGVDDRGTRSRSDDVMASWSSRGTTQDGFRKPEIFATGTRIVSNLSPGSDFSSLCPGCIIDKEYIRAGGTSMSAPMVAGLAALILQARPELQPDQVKHVILDSAVTLPGSIPAIDALKAVRTASTGFIPYANQGIAPNSLIDPSTGNIDYTRSSWSRSSWSSAADALTATWARSSWSCSCLSGTEDILTSRSSWSRSSWSTAWGL